MADPIQSIVDAQVEINRAVFEGNKHEPDSAYLLKCITAAQQELANAGAVLLKNWVRQMTRRPKKRAHHSRTRA